MWNSNTTTLDDRKVFIECIIDLEGKGKTIAGVSSQFYVTVESSRSMITLPGLALYVAKLALAQSMGYSY
jgi:hypothetical protein